MKQIHLLYLLVLSTLAVITFGGICFQCKDFSSLDDCTQSAGCEWDDSSKICSFRDTNQQVWNALASGEKCDVHSEIFCSGSDQFTYTNKCYWKDSKCGVMDVTQPCSTWTGSDQCTATGFCLWDGTKCYQKQCEQFKSLDACMPVQVGAITAQYCKWTDGTIDEFGVVSNATCQALEDLSSLAKTDCQTVVNKRRFWKMDGGKCIDCAGNYTTSGTMQSIVNPLLLVVAGLMIGL